METIEVDEIIHRAITMVCKPGVQVVVVHLGLHLQAKIKMVISNR
jgi:hypothetical protein